MFLMRKNFLLLFYVLSFIAIIFCGFDLKKKDFVVGFDAEFPPYGYKNEDGDYVGFDLDLAEKVCVLNDWHLIKQPIDWNAKDMELQAGNIDCIWNGFSINGREDKYTWSVPYINNSQAVVVKSNSGIENLDDLENKVVAVQNGSSAFALFKGENLEEKNILLAKKFKDLVLVEDYNNAFLNLESGVIDAICLDFGVANYEVKSRGDKFIILSECLSQEKYGIGFLKGNYELRNKVQAGLFELLKNGEFLETAKKYGLEDSICLNEKDIVREDKNLGLEKKLFSEILDTAKNILPGFYKSCLIFILTILFSLPLGLFIAFARMSKIKFLSLITKLYISIMRGTPLILQLLLFFYGPYFLFGFKIDLAYRFWAVIIGFVVNYAAYFAEIYRGGIKSISKGQYEAAEILGYSKSQCFLRIILPQVLRNILPAITNEIIVLIKDTSLAFAVSYGEMFALAKEISATKTSVLPLFVAGLFYYVFNFIVECVMNLLENKIDYLKGRKK